MNFNRPNHYIKIIFSGLGLLLFQNCALVSTQPPSLPFGPQKIAELISVVNEQDKKVHSFFYSGRLTLKMNGAETESSILVAGTRDPVRIKIEITHTWGRPLFHILINESMLHIISFDDQQYYSGSLGTITSTKFFPGKLDADQVWALLRGYPVLRKHNHAVSLKGGQITLLNKKSETVQVIDFYPQSNLCRLILFPERDIKLSFSKFQKKSDIYYARNITLNDLDAGTLLSVDLKQMVLNQSVPKGILEIEIPSDYKMLPPGEPTKE